MCEVCDKEIAKSNKYNHNKTKLHLNNINKTK